MAAEGQTDVREHAKPIGNLAAKPALIWQRVEDNTFHLRTRARALTFPEKFYRTIDFRRQAFVHRTIERGLLEHFALRMILWQRNMDFGGQSNDPTRRVLRHFLLH